MGRIGKKSPEICNITSDLTIIKNLIQEIEADIPSAKRGNMLAISRLFKKYGKIKEFCTSSRKELGHARKTITNYKLQNKKVI